MNQFFILNIITMEDVIISIDGGGCCGSGCC